MSINKGNLNDNFNKQTQKSCLTLSLYFINLIKGEKKIRKMNIQGELFCSNLSELENLLHIDAATIQVNKSESTTKRCLNDISNISLSKKQRTQIMPYVLVSCDEGIFYADTIERRNARERNRVRQVNRAFEDLQWATNSEFSNKSGEKKRISKLNILKRAIARIQYLTEILHEDNLRQRNVEASSVCNNIHATARMSFSYNKVIKKLKLKAKIFSSA